MNFRTTIVLAVALLAAFLVVFFTQDKDASQTAKSTSTEEKRLLEGWSESSVNRVALTQPEGKRVVIERSGSDWRLKEPVESRADNFQAGNIARSVAEMTTRGEADASKISAANLDKPTYVAELTDKGGKTVKVSFGARPPLGDDLVVKVEGPDAGKVRTELVDASVLDRLDEEPEKFRDTSLVEARQEQVSRIAIARPEGPLVLEKKGADWNVTEPKAMPADATEVSSLLSSLTSLRAEDFVKPGATHPRGYGLKDPAMTVSLLVESAPALPTTNPAVTQPTTKPATTTVIKFGDPVDIRRRQVYAAVGDGPVAKVAATSLDPFKKTPLALRNREVLNVDPNTVNKVSIATDTPAATQPIVKPPVKQLVVLERRSDAQPATGPAAPPKVSQATTPDGSGVVTLAGLQEASAPAPPKPASTGPATKPTTGPTTKPTTGPTTKPVDLPPPPQTKWIITSEPKGDADDAKVGLLLNALHPLRVEKFIESLPTSQPTPAGTYVVKIHTRSWGDEPAREHELKITDPGGQAKLIGVLGDLTFELDRTALDAFTADFAAPKLQPAGPIFTPSAPAPPQLPQ